MELRELQNRLKQIDDTDKQVENYFYKLVEEVGELSEVIRKKGKKRKDQESIKGTIEEELYDVLYYLMGLANIFDIDLEECAMLKEEYNAIKYHRKSIFNDKISQ